MARIVQSPAAKADLKDLARHLGEAAGARVAGKWVRKLRATIQLLADYPLAGRADDDLGAGRRRIAERPYVIVYEVRGSTVRIVRILDGRRDLPEIMAASND